MVDKSIPKTNSRFRETLLKRLVRRAQANDITPWTRRSQKWFRDKVSLFASKTTFKNVERDAIKTNKLLQTNPGIGFMYMFAYKAKWDKKLEYWDRFPLIFVIERYKNGFLGINLHYLSPKQRAILMDKLLDLATNTTYTNKTRLIISYQILNSAARYELFKPCVKRYLYSQLQSQLIKITYDEWEPAIYMPTESFVRASKVKVWRDSLRKVRGNSL